MRKYLCSSRQELKQKTTNSYPLQTLNHFHRFPEWNPGKKEQLAKHWINVWWTDEWMDGWMDGWMEENQLISQSQRENWMSKNWEKYHNKLKNQPQQENLDIFSADHYHPHDSPRNIKFLGTSMPDFKFQGDKNLTKSPWLRYTPLLEGGSHPQLHFRIIWGAFWAFKFLSIT